MVRRFWLVVAATSWPGSVGVGVPEEASCFDEAGQRYCLPRLLGVATVGSGTTSLAAYLNAHPLLSSGDTKEHHFFRFRSIGAFDETTRSLARATLFDGRDIDVNATFSSSVALSSPFSSDQKNNADDDGAPPTSIMLLSQTGKAETWRDYARQFPVEPKGWAFDFDPTYLAHGPGAASRAALASIAALYRSHAPPALVAVLRHPARQHCARISGRGAHAEDAARCAVALSQSDWRLADATCPKLARARLHNYCYAEHVVEWDAVFGAKAHLVKSEELLDAATRRHVVQTLIHAVFPEIDLLAFDWPTHVLDKMHNVHHRDNTDADDACVAAHTRPGTYLSRCNARLVALRDGDTRWFWWDDGDNEYDADLPPDEL